MTQYLAIWAACLFLSSALISTTSDAQTTQTALQSAANAFSQGHPVNSVTLTATAQWIAGGDNETGNATLVANADGSFNLQLNLSQSTRTEAQSSFASGQTCTWAGTDGVVQTAAGQNCMNSLGWFLPEVSLFGGQQAVSVNTGLMNGGASLQFLDLQQTQTQPAGMDASASVLLTHLSLVDLYLDPGTYLPSIVAYNQHPDSTATIDIPVQVMFTNYQAVNGVNLPFRITRYVNGVLNLDLTVSQATTN